MTMCRKTERVKGFLSPGPRMPVDTPAARAHNPARAMPMTREDAVSTKVLRVPIPKTRDPFVNTPLLSLGKDRRGIERFWISSWNSTVGCMGLVVDETGRHRIYRFDRRFGGFYSAASENESTLWLCGDLGCVVWLDLRTGKFRWFETGAPYALVFQGMVLDRKTGKLFAAAFPPPRTVAFSFDFRRRKPVKVYRDPCPDNYMRFSFPNGDGTWSILFHCPGLSLVRWDPERETVDVTRLADRIDIHGPAGLLTRLIADDTGRVYFPGYGWYHPKTRRFLKTGPRPEREACWFARRGRLAFGTSGGGEETTVCAWDMKGGHVTELCTIPDTGGLGVKVAADGRIVCVNTYGVFYRFDASGTLEMTKTLPTDAIGRVDCVCRIDDDRLLGTPFITQRFWEANVRTKAGVDCGRAAPGGGEVLETWKIGRKVYMAAYTGGELVEYDPSVHPHFPENPRVVAKPPHGMRPVAAATDGRNIFYSCSTPYGTCGAVLTRYDTRTGHAVYAESPLPHLQIRSLCHDGKTDTLLCGSTIHSDCMSCPPVAKTCAVARVRSSDLKVMKRRRMPTGVDHVRVIGPLGRSRWLCAAGDNAWSDAGNRTFTLDGETLAMPPQGEWRDLPDGTRHVVYSGRPGRFVVQMNDGRVELWDMRKNVRLRRLARYNDVHKVVVQDASLYLVRRREIVILEDCLARL